VGEGGQRRCPRAAVACFIVYERNRMLARQRASAAKPVLQGNARSGVTKAPIGREEPAHVPPTPADLFNHMLRLTRNVHICHAARPRPEPRTEHGSHVQGRMVTELDDRHVFQRAVRRACCAAAKRAVCVVGAR